MCLLFWSWLVAVGSVEERPYWATARPPKDWFNRTRGLPDVKKTELKKRDPRVFLMDAEVLLWNRQEGWKAPLLELKKAADKALDIGPRTVVRVGKEDGGKDDGAKGDGAKDEDKVDHSYHSVGPYWWPDPLKADGLPYVWKPGKVNPDRKKKGDFFHFKEVVEGVTTLSLAYWFTSNETYAAHAAMLVRTWYLDDATKMDPQLEYAQEIPGLRKGRGDGIIDSDGQPNLVDAIGLLEGSEHFTKQDLNKTVIWFSDFLKWLQFSDNGQEERNHVNNHGIEYDAQTAAYALFVQQEDVATNIFLELPRRRIATQIESDGSQPFELQRDKSWDYSCLSTLRFAQVASLALNVGLDLWTYETPDGRSIKKAIDFLLTFAQGHKTWPYPQSVPLNPRKLVLPLYLAAQRHPAYADAALSIIHNSTNNLKKCSSLSWWALPGIVSPLAHLKKKKTDDTDIIPQAGRGGVVGKQHQA